MWQYTDGKNKFLGFFFGVCVLKNYQEVLGGKFIAINANMKKEDISQINNVTVYFKEVAKG